MGFWSFINKGINVKEKKCVSNGDVVTLEPPRDVVGAMPQQAAPLFDNKQELNTGAFGDHLSGATYGTRNILVIAPSTNQDVTNIVQNLQNGEACVINLENIPLADAQRRLDFLSGVICAMSGNIKALDKNKYILTPQGLGVRNR